MPILTGSEIARQVALRRLVIEPFDPQRLNPNSYDLGLHHELLVYEGVSFQNPLDSRKENRTKTLTIPERGLMLSPGVLYLGAVNEYTETRGYVPLIEGRSSTARLGITVHQAGFGDNGFEGRWTLEIEVIHPVIVYPGQRLCQIFYSTLEGEQTFYRGKYQGARGPEASRMWCDHVADGVTAEEVPPVRV